MGPNLGKPHSRQENPTREFAAYSNRARIPRNDCADDDDTFSRYCTRTVPCAQTAAVVLLQYCTLRVSGVVLYHTWYSYEYRSLVSTVLKTVRQAPILEKFAADAKSCGTSATMTCDIFFYIVRFRFLRP